jgi:hypothetical protein
MEERFDFFWAHDIIFQTFIARYCLIFIMAENLSNFSLPLHRYCHRPVWQTWRCRYRQLVTEGTQTTWLMR